jgi:hypothetical protein
VRKLLRLVMAGKTGDDLLFPLAAKTYLSHLRGACKLLNLGKSYVLHSLRHGGATEDYIGGTSVEDVLLRGRWVSTKSARVYIQSGRALLLQQRIPEKVRRLIALLKTDPYAAVTCSIKNATPNSAQCTPVQNSTPKSTPESVRTPTHTLIIRQGGKLVRRLPIRSPVVTRSLTLAREHKVYVG